MCGAIAAWKEFRAVNLRLHLLLFCSLSLAGLASLSTAQAETLLVQRVLQEHGANVPARGMSMTQVESEFGAPLDKLPPAGGDTPRRPVINRWVYDRYTVYFERDHVIDSVINRASPTEVGPKGTASQQ